MIHKSLLLGTTLVLCIFSLNASEEKNTVTVEVTSETDQLTPEEEALLIIMKELTDALVESSKGLADTIKNSETAGLEKAKKWAEEAKEDTKVAAEKLVQTSEKFGLESTNNFIKELKKFKPLIGALMFLSIVKAVTSTLNQ